MEQVEIEPLVSELEGRIDRLRSLYDMYFMGIERIEPLVPRKDVERRLAVLRKEQIRNTGVRFRFQMIIQRYNTYVTYWQRITRQIETGTFKRHVMRATARFGVDPAKEQPAEPPKEQAAEAEKGEAATASVVEEPAERVYELEEIADDTPPETIEEDPFGKMAPPEAPRAPPERFASAVKFELDDLADPFEEADPFPKPAQKKMSIPRVAPRVQGPGATPEDRRETERKIVAAPIARPAIAKRDSMSEAPRIDTPTAQNMLRAQGAGPPPPGVDPAARRPGTLPSAGAPAPAPRIISAGPPPRGSIPAPAVPGAPRVPSPVVRQAVPGGSTPPPVPAVPRPAPGSASIPVGATAARLAISTSTPAAPMARGAPAPMPHVVSARPPAASSPDLGARPPPVVSARPPAASSPDLGARPPPVVSARPPAASNPDFGARPPPVVGARPPAASSPDLGARPPPVVSARPPAALSPDFGARAPAAASPAVSARPPAATNPVVPKPPPAVSARPPAASPVGDLSGDRFGEIYSKYVETRRQHNEPTHAITREALAKQLNESTDRLKQKHGAKAIDFEVVVKDGRTILRPVVK